MSVSALVSVGVQAMKASYSALQTTSHNIANASVEGYSRQSVALETARSKYSGAGFFGLGVNVATTTRAHDAFLARETATAASQSAMDASRAEQLTRLESVFPIGEAGLGYKSMQFLNAMIDVAARPQDLSGREVVLARARELAAGFASASSQLDALQRGVTQDLENSVAAVNELSVRLAQANGEIAAALGAGHAPNDLLDERDRLVRQLSGYLQVTTVQAPDGTLGVFVAGGQRIVLGEEASKLAVVADPSDTSRSALAIVEGQGQRVLPPSLLAGGSIAGLLNFQTQDLARANNLIGHMARSIADRVNEQQSYGLDLLGRQGKDIFSVGAPRVLPVPGNNPATAAPQLTVVDAQVLQAADYELQVDPSAPGQYMVTRLTDGQRWSGVSSGRVIDGMRIDLPAPAPSNGDRFILQPVARAAAGMSMNLARPEELAAAAPLVASVRPENKGTMTFASLSMLVPLNGPAPNSTLTFTGAAASPAGALNYAWTENGTTYNGTWVAGQPLVLDGRLSLDLRGVPAVGDRLELGPTLNPSANNGNAMALANLREERFVGGNSVTEAYAGMIGDIGVRVQGSQTASRISAGVLAASEQRRTAQAGVNLDEEAAHLVHQQQQYQAAAKVLQVAQSVFDTLLDMAAR
jgi:flagellar hook-associated protein 1 FlgK